MSSILLMTLVFLKLESTDGRHVGRSFEVMGKSEAKTQPEHTYAYRNVDINNNQVLKMGGED